MSPKRRISLEDRGKMLSLSEEGYTQREIAACVGCTQQKASQIATRLHHKIKAEMLIEHGVNISFSTTQRRLREAGLKSCKPRKKPRLTARYKKPRLQFAQAHKDWTAEPVVSSYIQR